MWMTAPTLAARLHTASELSLDDIVKMVDELIEVHGDWMPKYN